MIAGLIALTFAAAFAGAAIYVNWVEQPARLALEEDALLSEWGPSDSRAVALLLALALAAAFAGFIAYFETQDVRYVFGALIAIASWPYAFFVMAPLNNQILRAARPRRRRGPRAGSPVGLRRGGHRRHRRAGGRHVPVDSVSGPERSVRRDLADALRFFTRLPLPAPPDAGSTSIASPGPCLSLARSSASPASSRLRRPRRSACRPSSAPRSLSPRSSPQPARCTRTGSPTSPTALAAARPGSASSPSCATAASAPTAPSPLSCRSSSGSAPCRRLSGTGLARRRAR